MYKRQVYNVLAVKKDGHKELIGMYVSESEGANVWLSVLTDLKARGMKDVLIACIDNLTGCLLYTSWNRALCIRLSRAFISFPS